VLYVDWLLAGRMTVPVVVYTELILLMMSSKPARNMYRLTIEVNS
jgi:hypothetical protein